MKTVALCHGSCIHLRQVWQPEAGCPAPVRCELGNHPESIGGHMLSSVRDLSDKQLQAIRASCSSYEGRENPW